jgi:hypothetical protein
MKCVLVAVLALSCVGCEITQEHAISIATRELGRRQLPLPRDYRAAAKQDVFTHQFGYVELWDVTFSTPRGKKLYTVCIDRYNRQIQAFFDER